MVRVEIIFDQDGLRHIVAWNRLGVKALCKQIH